MPFVKAYSKTPGARTIVYEDENGRKTAFQNGTRSWRTNNPGNLGKGAFATRHGAIGDDGVNAIFPDAAAGRAALGALLKGPAYRDKTIPQAMVKYAPAPTNDPAAYGRFLLRKTGLAPDRTLASLAAEEFAQLLAAIQAYEGWKEGKIVQEPAG